MIEENKSKIFHTRCKIEEINEISNKNLDSLFKKFTSNVFY